MATFLSLRLHHSLTLAAEHFEAGALSLEDGAAADGAHLHTGHRARDVEVLAVLPPRLQQRHAVAAADVLRRILREGGELMVDVLQREREREGVVMSVT